VTPGRGGPPAHFGGYGVDLSADGRRALFVSAARPSFPTSYRSEVYVRDLTSGRLIRPLQGVDFNGGDTARLTREGHRIVFTTSDRLDPRRDTDNGPDVYARNVAGGPYELLSTSSEGRKIPGGVSLDDVTEDGRYLTLTTTSPYGHSVLLKDTVTGALITVARPSQTRLSDGYVQGATVSEDGEKVAFTSARGNYPRQSDIWLWTRG